MINKMIFNIIVILTFLTSTYLSENQTLFLLGKISVSLLVTLATGMSIIIVMFGSRFIRGKMVYVWLSFFLFTFFNFLSSLNGSYIFGFKGTFQIVSVYSVFLSCYYFSYNLNVLQSIKKFVNILRLMIWAILIYALLGSEFNLYKAYFSNPNGLGMWLLTIYPWIFMATKNKCLKFLDLSIFIILILFSGSRNSLLGLLLFLIIYYTYSFWSYNKFRFYSLLWISTITSILIVLIFTSSNFSFLDDIAISYTNKSLLSGREDRWIATMQLISESFFLGVGKGYTLESLTGIDISPHNQYLNIFLQLGLIGIILFFLCVLSFWGLMFKNKNKNIIRYLTAYFFSILFIQNFEVSLIQSNLSLVFPFWAFIGIALGISNKEREIYNEKNDLLLSKPPISKP